MKILFAVCGIGLGHATRSHAIINQLSKFKNVDLKVTSYRASYNYFKKVGIPSEDIGGFDYKDRQFTFSALYNIFDFLKSPGKLKSYQTFDKVFNSFKPDIIFSDNDPYAFFYAYKNKIPNYTLTNLFTTSNNFYKLPKEFVTKDIMLQKFSIDRLLSTILKMGDKIYNPTFEQTLKYSEKLKYTDVIVRQKPEELPSESKIREELSIDKDFYYVHVGGSDIERYLFYILKKILLSYKDKFFIVSSNYAYQEKTKYSNMVVYPFIENPLPYVKSCKGIICPAGHSGISEAIVFKKPSLVIPVRNHIEQLINAILLEKYGLGQSCFLGNKNIADTLKEAITSFFNNEDKIKTNLKLSKINGNGAEQIAKDIISSI